MAERERRSVVWPSLQLNITSQEQACAVTCFAIQHLLFAKGQIEQPIAVLRKRRAQEKLHDHMTTVDDRRKRETKAFADRRRERRLDETLRDVDNLHERLVSAFDALSTQVDPSSSSSSDSVTLLLRLGQAPGGAFTKQQYAIRLHGVLSLPRTASWADQEERKKQKHALDDNAAPRAVFGGKANACVSTNPSSLSRLPALERKLVRFLLSVSMSNEDNAGLGRALATPLGPTRSQVFLLAPPLLEAQGWTPRRCLKVDVDNCIESAGQTHESVSRGSGNGSEHEQYDATHEHGAADDGSTGDVDELVQALSPLKRRKISSLLNDSSNETSHSTSVTVSTASEPIFFATPKRPSRRGNVAQTPSEGMLRNGTLHPHETAQATTISSSPVADVGMDAKRLARLQARRVSMSTLQPTLSRSSIPRRSRPRNGVLSAGFVIDCTPPEASDHDRTNAKGDAQWFASNIVFRASR